MSRGAGAGGCSPVAPALVEQTELLVEEAELAERARVGLGAAGLRPAACDTRRKVRLNETQKQL